jgi:hypothetical protein
LVLNEELLHRREVIQWGVVAFHLRWRC